jgi:hypothetical protein
MLPAFSTTQIIHQRRHGTTMTDKTHTQIIHQRRHDTTMNDCIGVPPFACSCLVDSFWELVVHPVMNY